MKTLKCIWSVWNKTDKIMAVISTIVLVTLIILFCTSCSAQPNINNIPTLEYYDASGENFDTGISIYPDGVIDFIYHTQDGEYVIEYDDEDAFDQDNMIYNNDFGYYYIEIYCDSADFYEYLNWYAQLNRYDDRFKCSNVTFGIIEDSLIESDGSITYYYHLQRRH